MLKVPVREQVYEECFFLIYFQMYEGQLWFTCTDIPLLHHIPKPLSITWEDLCIPHWQKPVIRG